MTSGRRRLRSSAALQAWQMKTINEFEVLLSSLEEPPLDELLAMVRKSIISHVNAQKNPTTLGTLWSEATASPQDLENALQMFSKECSGPH
jgi:hypothetical protein